MKKTEPWIRFVTNLEIEAHKIIKLAAAHKRMSMRTWLETYAAPIAEDQLHDSIKEWKKVVRRAQDER